MRQSGYYWVDYQGEWMIMYWELQGSIKIGYWTCVGNENVFIDSEFREIDERRIERQ